MQEYTCHVKKAAALEISGYGIFQNYLVPLEKEDIERVAKDFLPQLWVEINKRLPDDASATMYLDRLGIDYLVEYDGMRYAIDLTTARRTNAVRKRAKMEERLGFFAALKALPVMIRSPRGILPTNILGLINEAPMVNGVIDVRLGSDLCLVQ